MDVVLLSDKPTVLLMEIITHMHAVNCGYPKSVDALLRIIGYNPPMIQHSSITYSCHPNYVLIGPNASICMGNGEWEPDPQNLECKGIL